MLLKSFFKVVLLICIFIFKCNSECVNDKNVQLEKPLYLQFNGGFFYIHGLTNGEVVVIYKHPDEPKVFGQYTFKNDRCFYETVFYYVENERFEFTNPYIIDEQHFNISNKMNFNLDKEGYEIVYHVNPHGFGVFHNLKAENVKKVLNNPIVKKVDAPKVKGRPPMFPKLGKQNLKVSYMKNGENYIQFVSKRSQFSSIEGQYTFLTSDKRYHSVTYEIPLNDFDFNGIVIREYEISTVENFHKSGTLRIIVNKILMDVKYFVDKNGFFVSDIEKPQIPSASPPVPAPVAVTSRSTVLLKEIEKPKNSTRDPR